MIVKKDKINEKQSLLFLLFCAIQALVIERKRELINMESIKEE
jgi:hypothetical protein